MGKEAAHLLHLNPQDNVAVLCGPVIAGQALLLGQTILHAPKDLALGHKLAVRPIGKGEAITKYGSPIGYATEDIAQGDHVHLHNIASRYTAIQDIEGTNK